MVESRFHKRDAGIPRFLNDLKQLGIVNAEIDGYDVNPGTHDLLYGYLSEFHNTFQDIPRPGGSIFSWLTVSSMASSISSRLAGLPPGRCYQFAFDDPGSVDQALLKYSSTFEQEGDQATISACQFQVVDLGIHLGRHFSEKGPAGRYPTTVTGTRSAKTSSPAARAGVLQKLVMVPPPVESIRRNGLP